jgi:hypothetical protein
MTKLVRLKDAPEVFTEGAVYFAKILPYDVTKQTINLRPVYCVLCSTHYTMLKPANVEWAPTVVHVDCDGCGGNGLPRPR